MKKLLKLISINILIFLGLLLFLNFTAILVFKGYSFLKPQKELRMDLPNYKNIEWAAKHFKEFANLPTEYKSYVGWRRLPFKGETINIDDNGMRITPQSDKINDTSKLVVFLGGSAMWGTGSDDKNTIPALFSALANGAYRALNMAETGYNAFQGYLFLKIKTIEGLKPDIIVCYDGINETDALDPAVKPFSNARESQINKVIQGMDRNEVLSFRHFFIQPLKLFVDKLEIKLRSKPENKITTGIDNKINNERVRQVAAGLLESWQSTKDLADKEGAIFIGVLQPNIYLGNPRRDYLTTDENMKPKYQALYLEIARMLKDPKYFELSKRIIDLTSAFDGNEYIYIDDMHVSPNGNRIIAEKILTRIINNK
jgi:hypothetical protein